MAKRKIKASYTGADLDFQAFLWLAGSSARGVKTISDRAGSWRKRHHDVNSPVIARNRPSRQGCPWH